jgi:hypothetical protein
MLGSEFENVIFRVSPSAASENQSAANTHYVIGKIRVEFFDCAFGYVSIILTVRLQRKNYAKAVLFVSSVHRIQR